MAAVGGNHYLEFGMECAWNPLLRKTEFCVYLSDKNGSNDSNQQQIREGKKKKKKKRREKQERERKRKKKR